MILIRPSNATHALLTNQRGKSSLVPIKDLDVLEGSTGELTWLRFPTVKGPRELLGKIMFDGKIEGIESDYKTKHRK